jgi:hypothetical protein
MTLIRTIAREILGLFVDDGLFAASLLLWIGAVWLLLPHLGVPAAWTPYLLFAGLGAILLESAVRRAKRRT